MKKIFLITFLLLLTMIMSCIQEKSPATGITIAQAFDRTIMSLKIAMKQTELKENK
jgi:hypothetical protein